MGSIPAEGSEFFFILYILRFLATFNLPFENLTNNLQSEQEYRFKSDISQVDNLTSLGRVMYCSLTLRSEASSGSQVTVSCHKTWKVPPVHVTFKFRVPSQSRWLLGSSSDSLVISSCPSMVVFVLQKS